MKSGRKLLLFLVLVLGLFGLESKGLAATPSHPERIPRKIIEVEQFLIDLHNGLVQHGALDAEPVNRRRLWLELNPDTFASAIEDFFGLHAGGIVSAPDIFSGKNPVTVLPEANGEFIVSIENTHFRQSISSPNGAYACQLRHNIALTDELQPLHDIHHNAACLMILSTRNYYFPSSNNDPQARPSTPASFNFEHLEEAGIPNVLDTYLRTLQPRLLQSFELNLEDGEVILRNARHEFVGDLSGSIINPFATPQAEAEALSSLIHNVLSKDLVHISNSQTHSYSARDIAHALSEVASGKPTERRQAFFSRLGYSRLFEDRSTQSCAQLPPGSYGAGRRTPLNNEIVRIYGAISPTDFGERLRSQFPSYSFSDFLSTQISPLGYVWESYNFDSFSRRDPIDDPRFHGEEEWNQLACDLNRAQIIELMGHGNQNAEFLIHISHSEWGSERCCDRLKTISLAFGLNENESLECEGDSPPMRDRTGLMHAVGMWSNIFQKSKCSIAMDPNIWGRYGEKAIITSTQCFGNRCAYIAPLVKNLVMDWILGPMEPQAVVTYGWDVGRLAKDMLGEAAYAFDYSSSAEHFQVEPFEQYSFSGERAIHPAGPLAYRDAEMSAIRRGRRSHRLIPITSTYNGEHRLRQCQSNPRRYANGDGYCKYFGLVAEGRNDTRIEAAATVSSVSFAAGDGLNTIGLSFSSPLSESTSAAQLEVSFSDSCPAFVDALTPSEVEKVLSSTGGSVKVWNNRLLMPPTTWASLSDQEFAERYNGQERASFQSKMTLRVDGVQSPNGVLMVGNEAAPRKWLSPDGTTLEEPWRIKNGMFPDGGSSFEVDIPCNPQYVCEVKNFRFTVDGDGNQDVELNGTRILPDVPGVDGLCSASLCFYEEYGLRRVSEHLSRQSCELGLGGQWVHFPAERHEWAKKCRQAYPENCAATIIVDEQDQPAHCPDGEEWVTHYEQDQYKHWPVDVNEPLQSERRAIYASCPVH